MISSLRLLKEWKTSLWCGYCHKKLCIRQMWIFLLTMIWFRTLTIKTSPKILGFPYWCTVGNTSLCTDVSKQPITIFYDVELCIIEWIRVLPPPLCCFFVSCPLHSQPILFIQNLKIAVSVNSLKPCFWHWQLLHLFPNMLRHLRPFC